MISVKKAGEALKDAGLVEELRLARSSPVCVSEFLSVGNETYGRKSFLYFRAVSYEVAARAAKVLRAVGGKPNFSWCPGDDGMFDLRVSYFRGWHYGE